MVTGEFAYEPGRGGGLREQKLEVLCWRLEAKSQPERRERIEVGARCRTRVGTPRAALRSSGQGVAGASIVSQSHSG